MTIMKNVIIHYVAMILISAVCATIITVLSITDTIYGPGYVVAVITLFIVIVMTWIIGIARLYRKNNRLQYVSLVEEEHWGV